MKEIKLTIDGKEVQLTDEQLRMLGIDAENKKNPFDRVNPDADDKYYYIRVSGDVAGYHDVNDNGDRLLYEASNYFNDEAFANQVALHQLLYRKLLKFAYDNAFEDTVEWNGMFNPMYDSTCDNTAEWSKRKQHYSVRYSYEDSTFVVFCQYDDKGQDVYFSSEEAAKRAIEEVIIPFMKEHSEFVW